MERHYRQWTYEEIGILLGISGDLAQSIHDRALIKLRKIAEAEGYKVDELLAKPSERGVYRRTDGVW